MNTQTKKNKIKEKYTLVLNKEEAALLHNFMPEYIRMIPVMAYMTIEDTILDIHKKLGQYQYSESVKLKLTASKCIVLCSVMETAPGPATLIQTMVEMDQFVKGYEIRKRNQINS